MSLPSGQNQGQVNSPENSTGSWSKKLQGPAGQPGNKAQLGQAARPNNFNCLFVLPSPIGRGQTAGQQPGRENMTSWETSYPAGTVTRLCLLASFMSPTIAHFINLCKADIKSAAPTLWVLESSDSTIGTSLHTMWLASASPESFTECHEATVQALRRSHTLAVRRMP